MIAQHGKIIKGTSTKFEDIISYSNSTSQEREIDWNVPPNYDEYTGDGHQIMDKKEVEIMEICAAEKFRSESSLNYDNVMLLKDLLK